MSKYRQLLLFDGGVYNEMLSSSIDNWEAFIKATKSQSLGENKGRRVGAPKTKKKRKPNNKKDN